MITVRTHLPGWQLTFVITREALRAAPEWTAEQPNPPLPIRDAILAGQRRLRTIVEYEIEWVLHSVQLFEERLTKRWYYQLNFWQVRDKEGNDLVIMGSPYRLPTFVLMDGSSIEPQIVPLDEG